MVNFEQKNIYMNNSEITLNAPTIILFAGTFILGIFGGWFFASYLMRASVEQLTEQSKRLKDNFKLVRKKIDGFEKLKQHEYHNILKEVKEIVKSFK
jgi:Tfp pilus assembly protein PilO